MFEFLFKYPFSMYHKGQFVLLTPWPLWILAVAILAAAGLLYWHVRRNHGMLTGCGPSPSGSSKSGLIALILFLLWHPALSIATLRPNRTWWRYWWTIREYEHRRPIGHSRSGGEAILDGAC